MERLIFLMSFCLLLSNAQQAPSFLITAPNVVHLGTPETVTVQVHGVQSPVQVTAYFKDEAKNKLVSAKTTFNLNQGNNYQQIKKLLINPENVNMDMSMRTRLPYVLLVTESRHLFGEAVQTIRILLSSKKGYIFIQTDKPIYTPNSKVKFRVFILDNAMRPTSEAIQVAVINSRGMVTKKSEWRVKTVLNEHFVIPDIAEPGTWKIMAWFQDYEMSNASAEFEVKKYELPSFDVKLIPLQPYYHIWNQSFVFDIEAKHSYGKGIDGIAYVRFGVVDETEKKVFLTGLEQQLSIQKGKGRVTLSTPMLEEKLKSNISTLEGFHLYIAVTTVETASGEIREEELSNVKFVKSPYVVDLSNTKKYFVPGAPFSVLASVTLTDGSPAASLPVTATVTSSGTPMKSTALSNKEGLVHFTFSIPGDAQVLQIKVKAEEGKEKLESPEARIRAERYRSDTRNYLSISVPHAVLTPGDTLRVTLNAVHQSGSGKIDYFYYMVVVKGQTELLGRIPYSNKMINLQITEKMVPAFRLVAYYFIENGGRREIVADSVWVDIVDVCEGKIKVRTEHERYEPTDSINLLVETDHEGIVALAVVDRAVFILNKKNKLTSRKVFNAMNSYDLGCSAGGGADNAQVFTDVGLAYLSDTIKSDLREGYRCPQNTRRQKRSLDFQKITSAISKKYEDPDLQKCCQDGMKLNPMKFTCDKRLTRVTGSAECQKAFKFCCEKATELRKILATRRTRVGLARNFDLYEDEIFDESSITLRSYFPESWWWNLKELKHPGNHSIKSVVPDSITTWEIQAISISPQKGFCIADPHTFEVFKDFFISLRLPYSVKRHEQLEIKAVIYNYLPEDLQVTVKMAAQKGLCTAETTDRSVQLKLTAAGNSATPAYFSVVPLTVGEIPITITAFDPISGHSDSIRKMLNVVAEGVLQREEQTICINSDFKYRTLDLGKPSNMVPDSDSHVFVSLKGDIMGASTENCLTANGIDKLIQLPKGCAEQTMVKMAPAVFAIEYLDASDQWVNLSPERKDEAIRMIEQGYTRVLEFQKDDGSYGAFKSIPSSVWLTAFIVKVLARSREYISVQDSHIHKSITYLLNNQQADNSFHDPHPVLDRNMQGGIKTEEEDLALTAFVIIALQQSLPVYNESSAAMDVITKSVAYMKNYLSRNLNFYSTAITAYALTLVQSHSDEAKWATEKLRGCSSFDEEKQQRYWGNGRDTVSVEATAYALLQTLLLRDMDYARPIATWLTEKRNYGGGFCSTQDTVVALEALSAYSIQALETSSGSLSVRVETPGRQKSYLIALTDRDEEIQKALEFDLGSQLHVSVEGRGNGTMSILKVYQSSELKESKCDDLILTVEMEGVVKYADAEYAYENYDYESVAIEATQHEPLLDIEWFDIHNRRKRDVISSKKTESLRYKVCVRSASANVPKMSLVDLSLLSGLEPDTKELEQLVTSSDKYIQHFEHKEGKVLLYFGEITTGPEPDCISFEAKQINPMGLVQPANAILYDFYNPERKCSIFYSAPQHSAMLSKMCHADVCQCAEGPCPRQRSTFSKAVTSARVNFVCYNPTADYVYEVELLNSTQKNVFDYYEAKIQRILKITADENIYVGAQRQFLKRSSCKLDMEMGKRYLLMGKDGHTIDDKNRLQYFLDSQTWVEQIPENSMCQATLQRQACIHLQDFLNRHDFLCHF